MQEPVDEMEPSAEQPVTEVPSVRYSRDELLALRDRPACRGLPPGLEADDLSDLQESCFFDKSPTLDAGIYLGPQRGPAGPRAPFGAAARRPAGVRPSNLQCCTHLLHCCAQLNVRAVAGCAAWPVP